MIINQIDNLTTVGVKKNIDEKIINLFRANSPSVMIQHQKFLDRVFEMIINTAYPIARFSHWKDLKQDYQRDFDIIKKYKKLTKYQREKFIKDHELDEVDKFVISLNPNKCQFKFVKNVMLKKEYKLKLNIQEGIRQLLKAKKTFEEANAEIYSFTNFFMKCGSLSPEQFINSRVREMIINHEDAFRNIWNIKVES
mmetsp:Transcript_888/g.770  ORF Transcript_888/g.770 Transcript_888/m.770 type:complete len:196 (+) Transcript_888:394-981(+)